MQSRQHKGFSLVEGLLAIALFTLFVVSIGTASIYAQQGAQSAGNHTRATFLALEGIEGAYNIAANSFDDLTAGSHGLAENLGVWSLNGTDTTENIFTRTLTISSEEATKKHVTSTVSWSNALFRSGQVALGTTLIDWKSNTGSLAPGSFVTFFDETNKQLKLSSCASDCQQASEWSTITVDAQNDVGRYASLGSVGSSMGIAYYNKDQKDLMYAHCDNSCDNPVNWLATTAASAGDVGEYTSIAFEEDKPRITFYDEGNKNLLLALCDQSCTSSANWSTLTIDNGSEVGKYSSLAIAADGSMHITYYDEDNKDLKYALCASSCDQGAHWSTASVDTNKEAGQHTSLALYDGKPRVSYYQEKNDDLRYAFCDSNCLQSGQWTVVDVDKSGKTGLYSSLILDDDKPRISYYKENKKDLMYSYCDADCSDKNNWTKVKVLTSGDVGMYTSLSYPSSTPRIFFYKEDDKDLMQAHCSDNCDSAGNWSTLTIYSDGDVGTYASAHN